MRVVSPPREAYGDGLGVADRPVDDARPGVLVRGGLRCHADTAPTGDHVQPVVDVMGLLRRRAGAGRPQLGCGGAGPPVDQQSALAEVGKTQRAACGQGIVGGQGTQAPLQTDDGPLEAAEWPGSILVSVVRVMPEALREGDPSTQGG